MKPMRIFISYRRKDTRGYAGWLYHSLRDRYGSKNIFRDVAALQAGRSFIAEIEKAITHADVVLCLIGPEWVEIKDNRGNRRIAQEDDPVRVEIATALQKKKPVIPVLFERAGFPNRDELPADLQGLCDLSGLWLDDDGWDNDFEQLVKHIDAHRSAEKLKGADILARFEADKNGPNWVGRNGGASGSLFGRDVESGDWRNHTYEVSYQLAIPNTRNWMPVAEFATRVSAAEPSS